MDSCIQKLIGYLENECKKLKDGIVSRAMKKKSTNILPEDEPIINEIAEMKRVVRLLSTSKEDWDKYAEVYIDFNILENMLSLSPLKVREQLAVMLTMLEKNLATPILGEEAGGFDAPALDNYEFKTMTNQEARDLVMSEEYGRLALASEDELTDEEKAKYAELKEFIDSHPLDLSYIKELHQNISMHYFEKRDTFDYDDVRAIVYVLESFGVSKEFGEKIKVILDKEVKKREPKEQIVIVRDFHKKLDENRITEKEYNLLNRELKKFFDLTNMLPVQPMMIEMQIYCVSLMLRMGIPEETIKKALKAMNRNNKYLSNTENPVVLFSRLYERLSFYQEREELQESVQQMMTFFQEMLICSDDDYEFWKSMMGEELEKANGLVPNTYEYEIEEARKLNKTNK